MINVMGVRMNNKQIIFLLLMVGLGVGIGIFLQYYLKVGRQSKFSDGTQIELVKKIQPIPEGKQVFRFSHGDEVVGPKIKTLEINEMKPEVGKMQRVTLAIQNDTPVDKVVLTLVTDVKENDYVLKKKSGTDLDGVWEIEWLVDDTYNYRYKIKFDLESMSGNYQDVMIFRK